jgi:hypothetical protein
MAFLKRLEFSCLSTVKNAKEILGIENLMIKAGMGSTI